MIVFTTPEDDVININEDLPREIRAVDFDGNIIAKCYSYDDPFSWKSWLVLTEADEFNKQLIASQLAIAFSSLVMLTRTVNNGQRRYSM